MREQRVVLEDGVDVALVGRHALGRLAENLDVALVGCSKPAIRRRQVVLPEPEGPSMAKNSPSAMSRVTPSTARTAPKWRQTLTNLTAGDMGWAIAEAARSFAIRAAHASVGYLPRMAM